MGLLALGAGYLLGAIPFPLAVARLVRGIDLRQHGSGNMGALNTARVVGVGWGILAGLLDAAKGAGAALLGAWLLGPHGGALPGAMAGGAGAAAGHVWPVFAAFRGGKGLAASAAALLVAAPAVLLAESVVLAAAAVLAHVLVPDRPRREALVPGGMAAAAALPAVVWLQTRSPAATLLGAAWGAVVFWPHWADRRGRHGAHRG